MKVENSHILSFFMGCAYILLMMIFTSWLRLTIVLYLYSSFRNYEEDLKMNIKDLEAIKKRHSISIMEVHLYKDQKKCVVYINNDMEIYVEDECTEGHAKKITSFLGLPEFYCFASKRWKIKVEEEGSE